MREPREPIHRILVPFLESEMVRLDILDKTPAERAAAIRKKARMPKWKAKRGAPVKRQVGVDALVEAIREGA